MYKKTILKLLCTKKTRKPPKKVMRHSCKFWSSIYLIYDHTYSLSNVNMEKP